MPLTLEALLAVEVAASVGFNDEEASRFRAELESAFLNLYFYCHLRNQTVSDADRRHIIAVLEQSGYSRESIGRALDRLRDGEIVAHILQWLVQQSQVFGLPLHQVVNVPEVLSELHTAATERPEELETIGETESEASSQNDSGEGNKTKNGQNLLNLLFQIAEQQAQKDGYLHRGITCNSCNTHPIKGVRYRCVNCVDYDLCESCESVQPHIGTHIFYKIRIPRAHVGHQPQPVIYPGQYSKLDQTLRRDLVKKYSEWTGFRESEVLGFWEQFKCLATVDWPNDPSSFYFAIDYRSFEQLFLSNSSTRLAPPNLIYDRVFNFYDTDQNALIGFDEFITGQSNLTKKGPKEKWKRVFRGFDIDGDGFVNRKDFLRMFKAHYSLTKQMTAEVVAGMEEENVEQDPRQLISGGQPLSSAFTASHPTGQASRTVEGKVRDVFGDEGIVDHVGAIEEDTNELNNEEMIAEIAEREKFNTTFYAELKTDDVQAVLREIMQDPWPPRALESEFVVPDSERNVEANDLLAVTDVDIQKNLRAVGHANLGMLWQIRTYTRFQAVKERRKRRRWHLNESPSTSLPQGPASEAAGETAEHGFDYGVTPTHARYASLFESLDNSQSFMDAVTKMVADLGWPMGNTPELFLRKLLQELGKEWTGAEIAESLKGFSLNTAEIQHFTKDLLRLFEKFSSAETLPETPASSTRQSRRSRSSSKVRFEDGLTTDDDEHDTRSVTSVSSKNIPVNERWGGYEISEPEEDVGREVLYQITQEALNEVIDPFFKAREDLWLEAQTTKAERNRHRAEIRAAVTFPATVVDYLHWYLGESRLKKNYPFPASQIPFEKSDAQTFLRFVKNYEGQERNRLTSEDCPKCPGRKIFLGKCCERCGSQSAVMALDLADSQARETEVCVVCKELGKVSRIGYRQHCGNCGRPSSSRFADDQRFQQILQGESGPEIGDTKAKKTGESPSVNAEALSGPISENNEVRAEYVKDKDDPAAIDRKGTRGPEEGSNASLPSEAPPGSDSQPTSEQPVTGNLTPATPTAAEVDTAPSPQMALDLDGAVQAFDQADPSVEERVAQKPLNVLLEESGYEMVDEHPSNSSQEAKAACDSEHVEPPPSPPSPSSSASNELVARTDASSPLPDPTLPQNRPNTVDADVKDGGKAPEKLKKKKKGKKAKRRDLPQTEEEKKDTIAELKYWAALYILEAEDEERGGPGRMSEEEFLQIMLGERGRALEFVGEWMNLTAF